jgi:GNAT superfamily N-acetyltransferase
MKRTQEMRPARPARAARTRNARTAGAGGSAGAAGAAAAAPPARPAGQIRIRQAGHADHGALRDFLTGLSVQTRYLRFFAGAMPTSPAMLRILAGDRPGSDALVAIRDGAIIGHAMAVDTTAPCGDPVAEVGVVVADAWQGQGVGTGLMRTVAARAAARGATGLVMEVMAENRRMLGMIAHRWPGARHDQSGAYVRVQARLAPGG